MVSLSVGRVRESSKTAQPIDMPFGELTRMDPRNHVLDGGQDRTNPSAAAMGDKSAMRPFAKLLWIRVIIIVNV